MERPRPATRCFILDRPYYDRVYGAKAADRLRLKIPQTIIAMQYMRAMSP